jgi:shikimate kinase
MQRIIVTGPKSSGKSSIGHRLAQLRKLQFWDLDERIEKMFEEEEHIPLSFREIFKRHGEEKFRELEMRAIKSLDGLDNILLATGGSTFLNETAKNTLCENSYIILLHNTPETLWTRTIRKGLPPYLDGTDDPKSEFFNRVKSVVEAVKPIAELTMETRNLSVEEVAQMLDYELDYRKIA